MDAERDMEMHRKNDEERRVTFYHTGMGQEKLDQNLKNERPVTQELLRGLVYYDERLLHPEFKEYFRKVFGITGVHPVFVDHSELVVLMLDDRGIMFRWNEMEHGMDCMGLANHLHYPENICVIVESTRELIL
ncbi:hypothetical protein RhiirA4_544800 [Rhizophagus irregularis]|uniref:Uncharacterized protein n=1 Tax=Rhizophagus irregularis TaxID=588596 RepID=A0A2I1GPZ9_9GLOM|nr:hypothetical protein RhiirA4_544800 [Rhizophagus irregularis]